MSSTVPYDMVVYRTSVLCHPQCPMTWLFIGHLYYVIHSALCHGCL